MLIDCGDCGEKVSDQAENCPKCGWPTWNALPFYARLLSPKPWEQKREGVFLRTMNFVTSAVLLVVGLVFLLGVLAAYSK